jgi:chromosome segregation ATPase
MEKCEPWTVAAVYLMQSGNEEKHYTNILNYIVETEATELIEKGMSASRAFNEILKHKVVSGRAIFKPEGSGYYSLEDEEATRKNEDIQNVIQYLKDNKPEVNLPIHEDKEKKAVKEDEIWGSDNEKLSDEARKLGEETSRLCDETKRLSDETMKLSDEARNLSDEVMKLSEENKNLREETTRLREENHQLCEEAERMREEKQQLNEKLESIKQLC